MSYEIYRRQYRIRRAALNGKEITVPPEVPMKPGDNVIVLYDNFVLYVPKGTLVNEILLRRAITEGPEADRG